MRILALSHTYPRTPGDHRGIFIKLMCEHFAKRHAIEVLIPRTPGLTVEPPAAGRPTVTPFAYFVPERWSVLGYGGALVADRSLSRASALLAPFYAVAGARRVRAGRANADLVHAHFLVPNGAMAAFACGDRPLVITLHGSDVYLAERSRLFRRAARYALAKAAAVVPVSEDLARRVIALGCDPAKVTVIPCGADPEVLARRTDPGARDRIRRELGIGSRPLALFVGNLLGKKGVVHLLRAIPALRAQVPEAAVAIVGDGPLRAGLEAEAARLGLHSPDLTFAGARSFDEVPQWYAAADVVAVPSVVDENGNVDGLPTVLLEAMACSLPVVASRVAGIPFAVADGESGLLVTPGSADELATALATLLPDPDLRASMGGMGRRRLDAELSWERIAARYDTVFEVALSRAKKK